MDETQAIASPKWLEDVMAAGHHFLPYRATHFPMPRFPIQGALDLVGVIPFIEY